MFQANKLKYILLKLLLKPLTKVVELKGLSSFFNFKCDSRFYFLNQKINNHKYFLFYITTDDLIFYVFLFYFSVPRLIVKNIEKLKYTKKPVIYKCTRCTKSYQLETSLRRHQRLECGVEPKHECLICGKKFTYKFMLTHHLVSCKKKTASKEMF